MCIITKPTAARSSPAASMLLGLLGKRSEPEFSISHMLNTSMPSKRLKMADCLSAPPSYCLLDCVSSSDLDGVKLALSMDGGKACQQSLGKALHLAVSNNCLAIVRALLEHQPSVVHAMDFFGTPVILRAAEKGHTRLIKLLVSHGADASASDRHGFTALHKLAVSGCTEIGEFLLDSYSRHLDKLRLPNVEVHRRKLAFVNAVTSLERLSAVHQACIHGRRGFLDLLVRHGADISLAGEGGVRPLHKAAAANREDIVAALLGHGGDVNATDDEGRAATHHAAVYGHMAVMKVLVHHKADLSLKDNSGHEAAHGLEMEDAAGLETLIAARQGTCFRPV